MKITSSAFENNGIIPEKYSCHGENINPPLNFEEIPENAASLALIVDDPDAPSGDFVHWLVFNIDPAITEAEEGVKIPGAIEGTNSSGSNNFIPPCPPAGLHHYYFRLYALDTPLTLDNQAAKPDLLDAMEGNILAKAELIGLFQA